MSHSQSLKEKKELDSDDYSIDMSSKSFSKSNGQGSTSILLRSDSSSSSSLNDSGQQIANKRVVKSCLWSTVIFSINFISSILVINLAKWYIFNLTLNNY